MKSNKPKAMYISSTGTHSFEDSPLKNYSTEYDYRIVFWDERTKIADFHWSDTKEFAFRKILLPGDDDPMKSPFEPDQITIVYDNGKIVNERYGE